MILKNYRLLEISLLFILVFQTLRSNLLANNLVLVLTGLFFLSFVLFSFLHVKLSGFRLLSLILLALTVFLPLLTRAISERGNNRGYVNVNESMLMVEHATKSLLAGNNPYSISYLEAVRQEKSQSGQKDYEIEDLKHLQYSPSIFWLTLPSYIVFQDLFHFFDLRIVLVFLLFISGLIGYLLTNRSVLFLIIFLFNPVFLSSLMQGSNDIVPLTFIFLSLLFLKFSKITYATIVLAIACGSKLTAIPFVPIYFGYLFVRKSQKESAFKQILIFIAFSLIIYLPFAIWNFWDLMSDLFIYQIGGGVIGKPIVGYLGLPQILHNFGLIDQDSSLPFFVLFVPIYFVFLYFFLKIVGKINDLSFYVIGYVVSFFVFLGFSRMIQTDYIAFISQFLVLSAFLDRKRKSS